MESQPQNPEFGNNPENFHLCNYSSCEVAQMHMLSYFASRCPFEPRHVISNNVAF